MSEETTSQSFATPVPPPVFTMRPERRLEEFGEHQQMVAEIAHAYDLPLVRFFSKRRDDCTATARHVAMALLSRYTPLTLKEIGNLFRRDHGTVIHGRERIRDLIRQDPGLRRYYQHLESKFFGVEHPPEERTPASREGRSRKPSNWDG